MAPPITQNRKNNLILQGRLLSEGLQEAQLTIAEWFALYNELKEDEDLRGVQEKVLGDLAQKLMAIQFASELKASNTAV